MTVPLPTVRATRYVTPLREGGSLPAVVDADDGSTWVVKFRGAGQGAKALVAEIVVGLLARALDLPVPDLSVVEVDASFGRTEKDPEIQDILSGSQGPNVGLRFLEGAFNYDPSAAGDLIPPGLSAPVVWLDALVLNPDRTPKNPNILISGRRPWLIDHGAALYFHHDWARMSSGRATAAFPQIESHVLLPTAQPLDVAHPGLAARLDERVLRRIVEQVPDSLLAGEEGGPAELRDRYVDFLARRLDAPAGWVAAAEDVRRRVLASPPRRLESRR